MSINNHDNPVVIFIRGLPGSGKTYIAKALQDAIGKDKIVMLDPDETDYSSKEYIEHSKAQAAEGVDEKLHAYRFLRTKAYNGIRSDKIIIWNQPFTNLEIFHKMVSRLKDHAAEHSKQLQMLIVEVEVDHNLAKKRVLARKQAGGHGPSDSTLERRIVDYKSYADQGFNAVTVYGKDDASISVSKIIDALKKIRDY